MSSSAGIEAEALKPRTTATALRRQVNKHGGASKAQLTLDSLRTHKLSLARVLQILARQAPLYRLDDVRWT
jgi:hypothetical protein